MVRSNQNQSDPSGGGRSNQDKVRFSEIMEKILVDKVG